MSSHLSHHPPEVLLAFIVSIVGSLRDREVACSASDRQGSNFESCVWRTVSSQSSHHPQEALLAQFSLYVHKGGLKPDSFHFFPGLYVHKNRKTPLISFHFKLPVGVFKRIYSTVLILLFEIKLKLTLICSHFAVLPNGQKKILIISQTFIACKIRFFRHFESMRNHNLLIFFRKNDALG